jgi:hypothetical protein
MAGMFSNRHFGPMEGAGGYSPHPPAAKPHGALVLEAMEAVEGFLEKVKKKKKRGTYIKNSTKLPSTASIRHTTAGAVLLSG